MRGPLEKDTCSDVILPALARAGWSPDQVRREFPLAARRVMSSGGVERELGDGRVDYVLEIVPGLPVAVVEAKRAYRSASDGLQQAVRYAEQLDVPLAFASNGREIVQRDLADGTEVLVRSFMTPAEAWHRFASARGLDHQGEALLRQPFNRNKRSASGDVIEPRWYQAVAVHRVLTAMAQGRRRVLLLMATGTGKTFTAMQLVHKLRAYHRVTHPDRNHRVLYLADRDALVKQPHRKDFSSAFGGDPLWRVSGEASRSREIYFATYQALAGGGDEGSLFRDYPEDFFDVVIVDECHRGSAAENSSWRRILEHFDSAVQIGLTATPKQDETIDTYRYFGEPVFTYSLRQGIEDGYLAPYRVRRVMLSPDTEGWKPDPGQLDRFGREIPEGRYSTRDFERVVRLLMRTDLVATFLSRLLRSDRTARMIIFCVDQQHADDMRRAMVNANRGLVAADPEWVVRIVGAEEEKARLLEAFSDAERDSPVVVTTSRLLSTGVDIEDLKYVVLFRPVGSVVEFKQIIGRGTRLYPEKGKTSFEIVDFVGATSHFADPDFDGFPVRIIENDEDDDATTEDEGGQEDDDEGVTPTVAEPEPPFTVTDLSEWVDTGPIDGDGHLRPEKLTVDDGRFFVVAEAVQVPDTSTGQLVLTEYGEFVAGRVRSLAGSPTAFTARWARQPSRLEVLDQLRQAGIDVAELVPPTEDEVDPLDVLLQLAWNVPARTRAERARRARETHHSDLEARSETARAVFNALLDRYADHGVDEITSPEVVRMPPISELGSPRDIVDGLGGSATLGSVLNEVQDWIYSDKSVS